MLIDSCVIIAYFALILSVGLWMGKSVKNMDDFSTGNRNYSAAFVFATLSASFIGGGFTMGLSEKVFSMGLVYVVALWGFSFKEIFIAKFIAPRMEPFKHAVSVGDIMGQLYGKHARLLTGLASAVVSAGIAGASFSALGYGMYVLTGIEPMVGILIGVAMVVTYSSFGGIKSVVANDMIHFCVLIVALPLVFVFGLLQIGGFSKLLAAVPPEHLTFTGSLSGVAVLGLFLNFLFGETLVPPYVQRLLIGRNVQATSKGTFWSAIISFPFFLLMGMIGLVALTMDPSISPNLALPYVINVSMPIGLKGLAIAGLLAVLMSSADSFLNAASISVVQDIVKPMKGISFNSRSQLIWSRITTVSVGALGGVFALSTKSALDILLVAYNFWTPFILVPLVAGILGFKASPRAFWIGCIGGISATCLWLSLMGDTDFNGSIVGIIVNLTLFVTIRFLERKQEPNLAIA